MPNNGTKTAEFGEEVVVLSERERDIVWLLMRGYTSCDISEMLGIDDKTVDNHRARLISRLRAKNTLHAIMLTLWGGLIDIHPDAKVIARYIAKLPPKKAKKAARA